MFALSILEAGDTMLVSELMTTTFYTLSPHQSIQDALQIFARTTAGIIPVIDAKGILVGILTKNRLIRAIAKGSSLDEPIVSFIVCEPVCLKPDHTVDEAKHILLKHAISQAPVVNPEGQPIGIVSTADCLHTYHIVSTMLDNQLKKLFDNLPFGLFSLDRQMRITAINPIARQILNVDPNHQPLTISDLPMETLDLKQMIKDAISSGQQTPKQKMSINHHSVLVECLPLYERERISGVMVMMEELTHIERLTEELHLTKEWEEKLRTVVELAYDGIVLVNEKGIITMANKGFCELFQVQAEQIIGQSVMEDFPDLGIRQVLQLGVPIQGTGKIISGKRCVITTLPIHDGKRVVGAVCKIMYRGLRQLHEALEKISRLEKQISYYQQELNDIKGTRYTFADIVGNSAKIRQVKKEAMLASRSPSTILICGESGTGKELFAHSIHVASGVPGAFVKVNCAAIPEELFESEFFGYEEGAFTGAKRGGKKGKFHLAQNGTLFLDEIGDMPLSMQVKLLRVLQEKEFEPLGSSRTIRVNVRIIAATNQDLERLVQEGKFREDLYYRINVFRIELPPLRERKEDIPEIVQTLIGKLNQSGFDLKGITPDALSLLLNYTWPGNIRELANVMERAANLTTNGYIDIEHLPTTILRQKPLDSPSPSVYAHPSNTNHIKMNNSYRDELKNKEKELILKALKQAQGNKTKASHLLGISRTWLYAKMKEYGIR